jgi:hypothetical protein
VPVGKVKVILATMFKQRLEEEGKTKATEDERITSLKGFLQELVKGKTLACIMHFRSPLLILTLCADKTLHIDILHQGFREAGEYFHSDLDVPKGAPAHQEASIAFFNADFLSCCKGKMAHYFALIKEFEKAVLLPQPCAFVLSLTAVLSSRGRERREGWSRRLQAQLQRKLQASS